MQRISGDGYQFSHLANNCCASHYVYVSTHFAISMAICMRSIYKCLKFIRQRHGNGSWYSHHKYRYSCKFHFWCCNWRWQCCRQFAKFRLQSGKFNCDTPINNELVSKFFLGLCGCSAFHFGKTTFCLRCASYRWLRLILYLLAIFRFCRWLLPFGEFIILLAPRPTLTSPVLPFFRVLGSQHAAFVRFQLSNFSKNVCWKAKIQCWQLRFSAHCWIFQFFQFCQ